ncbi:MAG: hypothetical protein LBL66_10720 [Clostridiales bacterium]|jgi:hypothetical protein|nr:hypothetical protein [Clostridiales bacterium]
MIKKIVGLGVLLMMISLVGCGNKYNAVVVDSGLVFRKEFLKANRTYGVTYYNEDYDKDGDRTDEYLVDRMSPKFRTFIIKEQNEFDDIFTDFSTEVNFEKELLLIYLFTSVYHRPCKIQSMKLDGETLKIDFKMKNAKPGVKDASVPEQRYLVIKMKNLDISAAEFVRLGDGQ